MHSYLRTIGFSEIKNRVDLKKLIQLIINKPTKKRLYQSDDNQQVFEISKDFVEGIGITVCGEYDENNEFHVEHFFPYFKGHYISTKEEVFITKRVDTDGYTGMCDDYRLGVSLIFYLQNAFHFIEVNKSIKTPTHYPITLSALALEGKIILQVEKTEYQLKLGIDDIKHKSKLMAEAKKGNQDAIDSLTIGDLDTITMVSKRIQYEDIYSIVDTSFIPYGSESDNYTVLGTILDYNIVLNNETKESIYTFKLECNHMCFEVCINKKDLIGEPLPGRRFKGIVWMQGYVDFSCS